MIARYAVLAGRMRQDMAALQRVVERVENLATRLPETYRGVSAELAAFTRFLEGLARDS